MDTIANPGSAQRPRLIVAAQPLVYVVDDDLSLRASLESLIADAGWRPALFCSAMEFLANQRPAVPSCLILEIGLPNLDGLELQRRLAAEHVDMPIIFIAARGDIPTTVRAMKAGAVEFLTKPFAPSAMLSAIQCALERSRVRLEEQATLQRLWIRYETLSRREREVMARVVLGALNKQVCADLGISEITVKQHRGRMMRKMRMRSLPELVTIAARLGLVTAGKG